MGKNYAHPLKTLKKHIITFTTTPAKSQKKLLKVHHSQYRKYYEIHTINLHQKIIDDKAVGVFANQAANHLQ